MYEPAAIPNSILVLLLRAFHSNDDGFLYCLLSQDRWPLFSPPSNGPLARSIKVGGGEKENKSKKNATAKTLKGTFTWIAMPPKNRTKVIFDKFFDFFHVVDVVPKLPIGKIIY